MWKKMCDQPVSVLNELMTKFGLIPEYDLVFSENGSHVNKFITRVTCPISTNGLTLSVQGHWGLSKKQSKRNAAEAFIKKYIDYNNNEPFLAVQGYSTPVVNITDLNRPKVLQLLCSILNLGNPKYSDVVLTEIAQIQLFIIECRVSYLWTRGQGKTKIIAKLDAATKMIKILMEAASLDEIFESPKLTELSNGEDIICFSDNFKTPTLSSSIGILGRKRMTEKSRDAHFATDTFQICANTNSKQALFKELNFGNRQKSISIAKSLEAKDDVEFFNEESYCVDNTVGSTISDEIDENLSYPQMIDKIQRNLKNFEKQLHDLILQAVTYGFSPTQKTVTILDREYKVIAGYDSEPKILEGTNKCTDECIRIACLTKVLTDLKVD